MKKRLFSIISLIACLCLVFSMSFNVASADERPENNPDDYYTAEEQQTTASGYTVETFSFYIEPWIETWFYGDRNGIESYDTQFEAQGLSIDYPVEEKAYKDLVEKAGEFIEFDTEKQEITENEDKVVVVKKTAKCKNRDVEFVFTYDQVNYTITWGTEVSQTMGELVGKAGLNTLMGMGTVFIVLIFISFIISLFNIFRKAGKKKENAAPAPVVTTPVTVPETVVEESGASDDELVAVISAAIAAYEADNEYIEVPADGLIVRSIRKRGFC